MDIVVINSVGPMASSAAASLIEKFGFLNIPVRKLGFHDYLCGKRSLSDPYMIDRITQIIDSHQSVQRQGGINVLDRDSSRQRQLVDKALVVNELEGLRKMPFKNAAQMYHKVRSAYAKAVVYKKIENIPEKHVELVTDLLSQSPGELYAEYQKNFDKVYMIHLHRDFVNWTNAMASQSFVKKRFFTRYKPMSIKRRLAAYQKYEDIVKAIPGLHLNFDELFLPNTMAAADKISDYFKIDIPKINWDTEIFDLYGKLTSFKKTFTAVDDQIDYLSGKTKNRIRTAVRGDLDNFDTFSIACRYLKDAVRFNLSKTPLK